MNKFLNILCILLLAIACSCSNDDGNQPILSFHSPAFLFDGEESVKVTIGMTVPPTQRTVIPFTISGTSQEGEDFSLSAHEFVMEAGQDTAAIIVTQLENFKDDSEIRLELQSVAGYKLGYYPFTLIPVKKSTPITVDFTAEQDTLSTELEIGVELYIGSKIYTPSANTTVPFEIASTSTAKLGEHFEIVGGKQELNVLAYTNHGTAKIRSLKKEEGKDLIVLTIPESSKYEAGEMYAIYIRIADQN